MHEDNSRRVLAWLREENNPFVSILVEGFLDMDREGGHRTESSRV